VPKGAPAETSNIFGWSLQTVVLKQGEAMSSRKSNELALGKGQAAATVNLTMLDLDDASFRLSYGFGLDFLKQSISRVGLINPPVLRKRADGRYQIVCGYKRMLALRELGVSAAACQLVPPETDDEACLLLSLYDNISHRELNPVDKSLALNRLLSHYSEKKIVSDFLPLLQLQPHITQFRAYQPLCLLDKEIRDAVVAGVIDVRSALSLARLDPEDRRCLAALLIDLQLSVSKQAEVIASVVEIGMRDGVSPQSVTGDPAIRSVLTDDKLNRPQKGAALLRRLRAMRYPLLTAKEKQVKGRLNALKLPRGVSITPPPFFEDNRYCLSVYFTDGQELKRRLEELEIIISDDLLPLE
jgi:ParB family chromosome partitioning protein